MNIIKFISVFLVITMLSIIANADPSRGRDSRDNHRDYRSTHNYSNSGRHYGYYRNPRGELVFGLLGVGIIAAVMANQASERVVYVPRPVYVQQPVYIDPQVISMTINIQNSNGSYTPVRLTKNGYQWVGPRGEVYDTVPTVGQLRLVYGF